MKNLRFLPAIDQLKNDKRFITLLEKQTLSETRLTTILKDHVDLIRNNLLSGVYGDQSFNREQLTELIFKLLYKTLIEDMTDYLKPVINATGVVLHTNLGRARLSSKAVQQIKQTALSYSTLEYDIQTGQRGSRHNLVEHYLTTLTGAEAAMVVNNNAAAVYLVLKTLAENREVIISRGELVEIGGSFRISEIMEESDAKLVDVGTTNKTHLHDYADAITEDTALLMKVHKSNFKIIGFSEEIDTSQLTDLSQAHDVPIYEDLGSGTLFDFKSKFIGNEPTVQEKVAQGIDIISFSGDKLLGGPQAGIIIGKKDYINRLKKHQLARVLRVDKFTLAGIEGTLKSYLNKQEADEIPTVRDILENKKTILKRAQSFINHFSNVNSDFIFTISEGYSKVGGGTMPDVDLKTYLVIVSHPVLSSTKIAQKLRLGKHPVIVRIQQDKVILDFRTISPEEVQPLVNIFLDLSNTH